MNDLPEVEGLSLTERAAICAGKSPDELRRLLSDGWITPNDVRREMLFAPIEHGDVFYKPSRKK